jgi:hypothetical protein
VTVHLQRLFTTPLWRGFWGELGWVLIGVPWTVVCVVFLVVGLALGAGLSPLFFGVLLLAGAVMAARGLGTVHRRLASGLLDIHVPDPHPPRFEPGLWNWMKARWVIRSPGGYSAISWCGCRCRCSAWPSSVRC